MRDWIEDIAAFICAILAAVGVITLFGMIAI